MLSIPIVPGFLHDVVMLTVGVRILYLSGSPMFFAVICHTLS